MAQVTSSGFPRRGLAPVFLLLALSLLPISLSEAADVPLEYGVKATFLLRFTQFIEWPSEALGPTDAPFNICVVGNDPFGAALDQIVSGETVNGRKVGDPKMDREPARGLCQIIFVPGQGESPGWLSGVGRGVLTVGEGESFVRNGGMIGFVVENRRVTFYINQRNAAAAGLDIRSGLLAVAKSVIR